MNTAVNHPDHYGGENNPYEAIKVIEAWGLGFNLGNVVKYISRAGKKGGASLSQDLQKAAWYLNREVESHLRKRAEGTPLLTAEIRNFFRHDFVKCRIHQSCDLSGRHSLKQLKQMDLMFSAMSDFEMIEMLLHLPEEVPETIVRVLITSCQDKIEVEIVRKMLS